LQHDLEAYGHAVWLDKQQIHSGASWEEQIEVAILGHEVFVSLLTPHAVRRPDGVCLDEISLARYGGRKIVPVMVLQCRPPLGIYRLDWVDFQEWQMPGRYEAGLRRLLAAVEGEAQVEGTYARLFATLKPLDFGAEVARLTRDFTGRAWLFAELDAWLADPASRVFLLTGNPGSGKSAVLAQLVQRDPRVAAYHFCVASLADSLDPFRFARSVAAQLATQLPGYRAALEAADLAATETDPGALFRRLVVDPLAAEQPDAPALIVVDALDEAAGYGGRTIAAVLAERLRDLPPWVRLVLSSRKAPALLDRFSAFGPRELDAARTENLADVAAYLAHRLAEPRLARVLAKAGVDAESTAAALIERGAGNFLYVVQAADALAAGQLDPRRPERFPAGLVGIYQDFFGRVYPAGVGFDRVRPLLDVILAAREPLTVEQIGRFAGADPFDAADLLEPLAAFFPLRQGRVEAYHKSVADWLAGEAGQSRAYRVNVAAGHRRLAEVLLAGWRAGERDRFTLSHLPAHLVAAGRSEVAYDLLIDYRFIRAKVEAGMVNELLDDYDLAVATAPTGHDPHVLALIQGALRLSAHALARDPAQLPSQLTGRLLARREMEIEKLLRQVCEQTKTPWLRPLKANLTAPGGPLVRTLAGHADVVAAVAITRDGRLVVSGSWDRTLKLWDLANGLELRTLAGHTGQVYAVAVTPDGRLAVSGSEDRTLKVWDLGNGVELHNLASHIEGVSAVAITPDGRLAVSGSYDNTLKVWDLATGTELCTLTGPTHGVPAVAVTTDGRLAVSGSGFWDPDLKVWDLATGTELRTLAGHEYGVPAVAVTPDGRLVISGSGDNTLKVWDLATGVELHTLVGHAHWVSAVAVTPDGRLAVSGSTDTTLKVWDLARGTELRSLAGHGEPVHAVAVTPDGRWAVSGSHDHTLKVWDLSTALNADQASDAELHALAGFHTDVVYAVAVTPDGRQAISGSGDKTIKLWDLASGAEQRTLAGHGGSVYAVAVTPDGRHVVAGPGHPGCRLRVWDLATGAELRTLAGFHHDDVLAVAVTPDGRQAVSGSRDNNLKVCDLTDGTELHTLAGHHGSVHALAVTSDGRQAVSGSDDLSLKVWDLASGAELRTLAGHTHWVHAVAVTPDGQRVVSGSHDHTIKVWDLTNGIELRTLAGHIHWVHAVAVTPDGQWVVSGSHDHTIKVWDLTNGYLLACFEDDSSVVTCAVGPDNISVVAGDMSGRVHVLCLENVTPGPMVVTARRSPGDFAIAFRCTHCHTWSEVPASALGTELPCPRCGKPVKLNPFVIEADWRPVAAAWKEESLDQGREER
jgi:WD40 repeat protein